MESVLELGAMLERGEYQRCLHRAAALLEEGDHDREELARIQGAICRSYLALTDYFAAAEAGAQALRLAEEADAPDLCGFTLLDLATARGAIRQYDAALAALSRFLEELPGYTAARCMEGRALRLMGDLLDRAGMTAEAFARYRQAHSWFERYGDDPGARDCRRGLIRLHLQNGEHTEAAALLHCNELSARRSPDDHPFLTAHWLDRGLLALLKGEHQASIHDSFRALEYAGDRLDQQAQAHLLLCQNAMALNQTHEALQFALAARVAAIDGRAYALEFEASDLLFRLLRRGGPALLQQVAHELYQQKVDIHHYLSDRVLRRYFTAQ